MVVNSAVRAARGSAGTTLMIPVYFTLNSSLGFLHFTTVSATITLEIHYISELP